MNKLALLEGLLFIKGDEGLTLDEISVHLNLKNTESEQLLAELKNKYQEATCGLMLKQVAGHYKITTKPEHHDFYNKFTSIEINSNLSVPALEVLAIIAYKGPLTRLEIDDIRGINSSHLIRKLVNLELIKEHGRSDTPGRPILYITTKRFLDFFNLNDLSELPEVTLKQTLEEDQDLYYTKYQED